MATAEELLAGLGDPLDPARYPWKDAGATLTAAERLRTVERALAA
jgi:hypothetical protein